LANAAMTPNGIPPIRQAGQFKSAPSSTLTLGSFLSKFRNRPGRIVGHPETDYKRTVGTECSWSVSPCAHMLPGID